MALQLPNIHNKPNSIHYNYRSLDASFNLRKTAPINKSQSQAITKNIERYYATSNVSDILGHEKEAYPTAFEEQLQVDQNGEVSGNLKQLRKQYDLLRSKSNKKEKEIIKMRNEIDQIKVQQEGMSGNKEFYQQKLKDLKQQQDNTSNQLLEARMNKKSYEHMIERMKNDLICFKKRVQQTQEDLNMGKTVLQSAKERYQKIKQKFNKIDSARGEVKRKQEEESNQRELNMEKFISQVMEKQDLEKQREARIKRQVEIAEIAANDIRDSNLKKWRKLLLVHQFLNNFLKRKMEREMAKYRGVEQAFQKIKASTGISEAGEIVHKFLNREHTYSHLLISIADYEQKIQSHKKLNENLKNKLSKLKQDITPIEKLDSKNINFELEEITQQYQQVTDKAEHCQLLQVRVFEWLKRNLMRLDRAIGQEKEKEDYDQMKKDDLPQIFEQISQILADNLLSQDQQEVSEAITNYIKSKNQLNKSTSSNDNRILNQTQVNEDDVQKNNDFLKRNVRAQPPSHRLDTPNESIHDSKYSDYTNTQEDQDEEDQQEEYNYLKQMRTNIKQQEPDRVSTVFNTNHKK